MSDESDPRLIAIPCIFVVLLFAFTISINCRWCNTICCNSSNRHIDIDKIQENPNDVTLIM